MSRLLKLFGLLAVAVFTVNGFAQLANPQWARWSVMSDPTLWDNRVQYGATGYSYYPVNGDTAYSTALRAQADFALAQSQAAEANARAAAANEEARRQYLENKAQYNEMRRQQRAAAEAKRAAEREEMKARAANRPAPKKPTEVYPRLSSDQLDPITGTIHWPETLMTAAYMEDRTSVEAALKEQAEHGPNARTASIIYSAARSMRTNLSKDMNRIGFEAYSANRKFLNSLALEGDHAMEALK
ncbi:MAG: hypothetical protein JNL58_24105 [Planctomyces sp.]|nr:hypothetical protein [Planctomyces sp.]